MTAQVLFNPLPYIDRLTRGGFTLDRARKAGQMLVHAPGFGFANEIGVNARVSWHEPAVLQMQPDFSALGERERVKAGADGAPALRGSVAHGVLERFVVEGALRHDVIDRWQGFGDDWAEQAGALDFLLLSAQDREALAPRVLERRAFGDAVEQHQAFSAWKTPCGGMAPTRRAAFKRAPERQSR